MEDLFDTLNQFRKKRIQRRTHIADSSWFDLDHAVAAGGNTLEELDFRPGSLEEGEVERDEIEELEFSESY